MLAAEPRWRSRLALGWFALGVLIALWGYAKAAIGSLSNTGALDFDSPLWMVEILYSAKGLKPYTDFGFVYPPGHVWLYGSILHLSSPASILIAASLVHLVLWSICAWQVVRLIPNWEWIGAVLLVVSCGGGKSEALALLLIAVLLVVETMERDVSAGRLAALLGASAAGAMFRWDWILAVAVLEAGWAATIWLTARRSEAGRSVAARQVARRLWWAALVALAGEALAMTAIAGYALAVGAWEETRIFIFQIPLQILPYRHLPFPTSMHALGRWGADAVGLALIVAAAWVDWYRTRAKDRFTGWLKCGALLAPCAALLPFALGRADEPHLAPLTSAVMIASVAAIAVWRSRVSRWLSVVAFLLTVGPSLKQLPQVVSAEGIQKPDVNLERFHRLTEECTGMFPNDARSLFVGQASYERYITNAPILYLMRPELRPATPFISDEPGVQNSCGLGSRIAGDLVRAPRPLVLVLDTELQEPEPNLTRTMRSCGKIEAAIAAMPAAELGTCRVGDDESMEDARSFRVMVLR